MTMECEAAQALIEACAAGEADGGIAEVEAHAAGCAACRARLAHARAIDAALAARPLPETPSRFTADVMARIRRERWRSEQWLDTGFNVAVIAGLLFVAAGVAGLLWTSGIAAVGGDLASLAAAGTSVVIDRIAHDAQNALLAVAFFGIALAVWWWTEAY